MSDEATGCGCLMVLWIPLVAFLGAWAAHCGWEMVR